MPTNWMERQCELLIHPYNGITSYSNASHLSSSVQYVSVSPSAWLGFVSLPAAALTSSSEAAGTVFMSKGVAQLDSVYE